jgi:hypothetical protein
MASTGMDDNSLVDDYSTLSNFRATGSQNTNDVLPLLNTMIFRSHDPIVDKLLTDHLSGIHDSDLIKTKDNEFHDTLIANLRRYITEMIFSDTSVDSSIRQMFAANLHFGATNDPDDGSRITHDRQLRGTIKRCDFAQSEGLLIIWVRHTLFFPTAFQPDRDWTTIHTQRQGQQDNLVYSMIPTTVQEASPSTALGDSSPPIADISTLSNIPVLPPRLLHEDAVGDDIPSGSLSNIPILRPHLLQEAAVDDVIPSGLLLNIRNRGSGQKENPCTADISTLSNIPLLRSRVLQDIDRDDISTTLSNLPAFRSHYLPDAINDHDVPMLVNIPRFRPRAPHQAVGDDISMLSKSSDHLGLLSNIPVPRSRFLPDEIPTKAHSDSSAPAVGDDIPMLSKFPNSLGLLSTIPALRSRVLKDAIPSTTAPGDSSPPAVGYDKLSKSPDALGLLSNISALRSRSFQDDNPPTATGDSSPPAVDDDIPMLSTYPDPLGLLSNVPSLQSQFLQDEIPSKAPSDSSTPAVGDATLSNIRSPRSPRSIDVLKSLQRVIFHPLDLEAASPATTPVPANPRATTVVTSLEAISPATSPAPAIPRATSAVTDLEATSAATDLEADSPATTPVPAIPRVTTVVTDLQDISPVTSPVPAIPRATSVVTDVAPLPAPPPLVPRTIPADPPFGPLLAPPSLVPRTIPADPPLDPAPRPPTDEPTIFIAVLRQVHFIRTGFTSPVNPTFLKVFFYPPGRPPGVLVLNPSPRLKIQISFPMMVFLHGSFLPSSLDCFATFDPRLHRSHLSLHNPPRSAMLQIRGWCC